MQHPRRTPFMPLALALSAGLWLSADVQAAGKDMAWLVNKHLSQVHGKLLADGWLPKETNLTTANGAPERSSGEAGVLLEAGYPAIERCTGAPRNYCFFNYTRRGQCLRVRTLGVLRPPGTEPKVHGAGNSCASRQSKR